MRILSSCFLGWVLAFCCVPCPAQDFSRMATADGYPFLAADLVGETREITVRLVPPSEAGNPSAPCVIAPPTRELLEGHFTRALNAWLEAARRARSKKRNQAHFAGVRIAEVKIRFCQADCSDADVHYSFTPVDLEDFLGKTVTRGGGFAGQINGRLWLVIGYPKELYQCQTSDGNPSACRAWNNRLAAWRIEGDDLEEKVKRMFQFFAEHEMGHVLGLSHYPGVMNKSIRADEAPARLCVKDGEQLLALMSFYQSRRRAEFVKSSLQSAFSVSGCAAR